ncbi:MAG: AAA family ATPase [Muribaculaceae bacterium]|nr:AAA family ATPase [Muribaculaceae bacterium]
MNFNDIPGHADAKDRLRALVSTAHVPHALLLSGPPGSGKMLLARTFAQYLHCEHPTDGNPCGKCNACRMHAENSHPDLHFVYPIVKSEKQKRTVSADVAEQWHEMLSTYPAMPVEKWHELLGAGNSQPVIYVNEADRIVEADALPAYSSTRKIFIIWQPERLRPEAANKLLKVIEEPSDTTLFIMVSNDPLKILPTIASRLQNIHIGRLSDSDIAGYLQQTKGLSDNDAWRLAPLAHGSLIESDELCRRSGEPLEFLQMYQESMRAAYSKRVGMLKSLAENAAAWGREKLCRYLTYSARMIRENFIYNMKVARLRTMTPDEEAFSQRFSPFINHANVEDFSEETDMARRDIERNGNAKLVMFDYFIHCIMLLHRKA